MGGAESDAPNQTPTYSSKVNIPSGVTLFWALNKLFFVDAESAASPQIGLFDFDGGSTGLI
jgi:hypothetical protein